MKVPTRSKLKGELMVSRGWSAWRACPMFIAVTAGLLICCAGCGGPGKEEMIRLVKEYQGTYGGKPPIFLDGKVVSRGMAKKFDDKKVWPARVSFRTITPGLCYGYDGSCGEAQCCEDNELRVIGEYRFYKSVSDVWKIFSAESIEKTDVAKHKRPASRSLHDFYEPSGEE